MLTDMCIDVYCEMLTDRWSRAMRDADRQTVECVLIDADRQAATCVMRDADRQMATCVMRDAVRQTDGHMCIERY